MADNSRIEWTESTWNPVTGCTKVSTGCKNCYAERMARRLQAMGSPNYANGFKVACHPEVLDRPLHWRQPRTVFVNSMSDLFHEDVPFDFIAAIFEVMTKAPWHLFQVLTKRSGRLVDLSDDLPWPANVWMGVTVENADNLFRIEHLRATSASARFLSLEPLLGPVPEIDLHDIDWVIVGGESGPSARPMSPDWAIDVRDRCLEADVPFFFKQWGGVNKKKTGRLLAGRTWDQMPETATREDCVDDQTALAGRRRPVCF